MAEPVRTPSPWRLDEDLIGLHLGASYEEVADVCNSVEASYLSVFSTKTEEGQEVYRSQGNHRLHGVTESTYTFWDDKLEDIRIVWDTGSPGQTYEALRQKLEQKFGQNGWQDGWVNTTVLNPRREERPREFGQNGWVNTTVLNPKREERLLVIGDMTLTLRLSISSFQPTNGTLHGRVLLQATHTALAKERERTREAAMTTGLGDM